jgi:hypothetical protein
MVAFPLLQETEMPKLYNVIRNDCIRSREGGYEVNDAHYTGQLIEVPDEPNADDVIKAIRKAGWLDHYPKKHIQVEFHDGGSIDIAATKPRIDGGYRPVLSLESAD